ncbi:MAG: hypothetical protein WD845_11425 [Pirellulales bacterium]
MRRSHGDNPARRSTKGEAPNLHATDGERLAQLERSLDRLAEQIKELRAALHR